MGNMTLAELDKCYKAAISREQEANREWSKATKKWIVERNGLNLEIERLKSIFKEAADYLDHGHGTTIPETSIFHRQFRDEGGE